MRDQPSPSRSNLDEASIIMVLKLYDGNWDTRVTGGGAKIQEMGFQHLSPCQPSKLPLYGWFCVLGSYIRLNVEKFDCIEE